MQLINAQNHYLKGFQDVLELSLLVQVLNDLGILKDKQVIR